MVRLARTSSLYHLGALCMLIVGAVSGYLGAISFPVAVALVAAGVTFDVVLNARKRRTA